MDEKLREEILKFCKNITEKAGYKWPKDANENNFTQLISEETGESFDDIVNKISDCADEEAKKILGRN